MVGICVHSSRTSPWIFWCSWTKFETDCLTWFARQVFAKEIVGVGVNYFACNPRRVEIAVECGSVVSERASQRVYTAVCSYSSYLAEVLQMCLKKKLPFFKLVAFRCKCSELLTVHLPFSGWCVTAAGKGERFDQVKRTVLPGFWHWLQLVYPLLIVVSVYQSYRVNSDAVNYLTLTLDSTVHWWTLMMDGEWSIDRLGCE